MKSVFESFCSTISDPLTLTGNESPLHVDISGSDLGESDGENGLLQELSNHLSTMSINVGLSGREPEILPEVEEISETNLRSEFQAELKI